MDIQKAANSGNGEAMPAISGSNPNQLALWGAASYSPKVPNPNSKHGQLLVLLLRGVKLNQELLLDEYRHLGWRLAALIKALEYMGWPFLKQDFQASEKRRITEYWLHPIVIAQFQDTLKGRFGYA